MSEQVREAGYAPHVCMHCWSSGGLDQLLRSCGHAPDVLGDSTIKYCNSDLDAEECAPPEQRKMR